MEKPSTDVIGPSTDVRGPSTDVIGPSTDVRGPSTDVLGRDTRAALPVGAAIVLGALVTIAVKRPRMPRMPRKFW